MTTNRNAPSKVCMTVLATTPQRNSRHGVTIAILLLVAQLVTGSGCGKTTKKDEEAARGQAAKRQIAELAKKHGANTSWADSIRKSTDYMEAFAFERQEAFDPLIGHPILVTVEIVDIYRVKDGYRLICRRQTFDPPLWAWGNLYFVLDLPQEKARQLAGTPRSPLGAFAVVAVPSSFDVRFNRELSAEDEASVSVGELSGELWVRGTCLEVEHIPGY